ncbi:MAG: hypothetical protein ACJ760_14730 [Thermoleophilaceae bacterium]
MSARGVRLAAAGAAVAGVVALVFGRVPLGYDSYFALVWGRALAHGRSPDLDPAFASTPHPLFNALATVLDWLPGSSADLLRALVLLALGALCVALFELGRRLAGWPVGLLAAAIVATRAPVLETALRAEVDIPAAALMAWATVVAAGPRRRDVPVLVLLALAGLLRPEAWVLALAYCAWRVRGDGDAATRRPAVLVALALAGPLLWLASDLALTGDALWSSHQTHRRVLASHDVTGFEALGRIPRHLGSILWVPALVAGVAGVGIALARLRTSVLLPLAAIAIAIGTSAALALAGQTVLLRFFLFPAALLAVFAAYALVGWIALPAADPARRSWLVAGALGLVALAAFVPKDAGRVGDLRDELRGDQRLQSRLVGLARGPAGAALRRCRPVYVQLGGVVPTLAYEAGVEPGRMSVDLRRLASHGVLVALGPVAPHELPYELPRARLRPPPAYPRRTGNESWAISWGCP